MPSVPSYIGQDEDEIDDLVCGRINPETGEIEYIEIVFFEARLAKCGKVILPINATLRPVNAQASAGVGAALFRRQNSDYQI